MSSTRRCALCGGSFVDGSTTFTVDYGVGVIVARRVPALVCDQCGETWLTDSVSARLEALVEDAKAKSRQFEVVDLAA